MRQRTVDILGYPVFAGDLQEIDHSSPVVVNTLNGHSYSVAKRDNQFKEALVCSDVLLPDGVSVVYGGKKLAKKCIKKIAGYDIFEHFLKCLNKEGGRCFFMGSLPSTLQKIERRIAREFPNIKVGTYSPPFAKVFSEDQCKQMLERVNTYKPDVLFVGMTAPKQEKWVHKYKNQLKVNAVCSIGAVFDYYAGTVSRAPKWMIRLKLEWFGRLVKQPGKMWKRYFVSTPQIFIDVFFEQFKRSNHVEAIEQEVN